MRMTAGAVRGVFLAAAVVAAVLTPGAAAAPSSPVPVATARAGTWLDGASPRGLAAYARPGAVVDSTAVYRRLLAAAVHAGADARSLTTALGRPAAKPTEDEGEVVVISSGGISGLNSIFTTIGDVDGNGTGDVADMRYAPRKDKGYDTVLYLRDGTTGRVLWQRRAVLPRSTFAFPVPLALGSPARNGVLLYEFGFQDDEDRTVTTQTLTALRGKDGRQLWRHRSVGEMRHTDTGYAGGSTYVAGKLPAAPGRPGELLLVAEEFDVNFDTGSRKGAVAGSALSVATGKVRPLVGRTASADSLPSLQLMPDLSGDGRDDLGLLVAGSASRVEARRGTDGGVLWSGGPGAMPDGSSLWPAGAVTGARAGGRVIGDIAVRVPPAHVTTISTPVGDVPVGPEHGQVVLLAGDTGTQAWSREGDMPVAVRRAGPERKPALAVATVDTSQDTSATTVTVRLVAYSGSGEMAYDKSYSASAPASDDFSFGFGAAYAFGDLQPDAADDVMVFLVILSGDEIHRRQLVVDGASGSQIASDAQPLGPSVTGRGMDLVSVKGGSTIQVAVRRGRDGGPLLSRTLRPGSSMPFAYAWSERLQSRCADVLVEGYGKTHEYVAVLTAAGAPRWSLLHKRATLAAGSVQKARPATPARC